MSMLSPRENARFTGNRAAVSCLMEAWKQRRVPHAIMLSGSRGIGKATLAYRFARFLLADGDIGDEGGKKEETPEDYAISSLFADEQQQQQPVCNDDAPMAMSDNHPVFCNVRAGSHPDLLVVEPQFDERKKVPRKNITVEETRKIADFLSLTPAQSKWRVVIIDSADVMNVNAANALLKILEEPPRQAVLLLISHCPGMVLPTIRSRCQRIPMKKLTHDQVCEVLSHVIPEEIPPADMRLINAISGGAAGVAAELYINGAEKIYEDLLQTLESDSFSDSEKFAAAISKAAENEKWNIFTIILPQILACLISMRAGGADLVGYELPSEIHDRLQKLSRVRQLDNWLELWEKIRILIADGERINLDRRQVALEIIHSVNKRAAA